MKLDLKIVIVNKSDSKGGAAVVSRRLMEALRAEGADARMIVVEKFTDSPYIDVAAPSFKLKSAFLAERLQIYLNNGFNRQNLFKVDTGAFGVNILNHPWVKEADVIMLNWVNQGFVSLKDIGKLAKEGKQIIWTMHDLWCMTGICHHTDGCMNYQNECHSCHFLKRNNSGKFSDEDPCSNRQTKPDLSTKVQSRKAKLYSSTDIKFVAVSSWLNHLSSISYLLGGESVSVIPNAFEMGERAAKASVKPRPAETDSTKKFRLIMGAARLDDTVKGLPVMVEATQIFSKRYPELASRTELVTFGDIRDPSVFDGFGISHEHLGVIRGEELLAELYSTASVVVSTSEYETLPGTLIEGQAYGAVPVSLDRGGQRDIIDSIPMPEDGKSFTESDIQGWKNGTFTGVLVQYHDNPHVRASRIAEALNIVLLVAGPEIRKRMAEEVERKFSSRSVAKAYLKLCMNEIPALPR